MNETPSIGHNQPPAEPAHERIDALIKATDSWCNDVPAINSQVQADKASDLLAQLRAEAKATEEERKKAKEPFLEAGRKVDALFNGAKDRLGLAATKIKALMEPWLKAEQERKDAERRARESEAERQRKEAEEAAKAAEADNTVDAQLEAERAAKAAEKAERDARQVGKAQAKGQYGQKAIGLRTSYYGEVTNYDDALRHYRYHPLVKEAVDNAVRRDVKDGIRQIPGVTIHQQQTV